MPALPARRGYSLDAARRRVLAVREVDVERFVVLERGPPDLPSAGGLVTFAPSRRASESPIAMACLRLVTFFPELPLRNVPALSSCITLPTFFDAFLLLVAINGPFLCERKRTHTDTSKPCALQPRSVSQRIAAAGANVLHAIRRDPSTAVRRVRPRGRSVRFGHATCVAIRKGRGICCLPPSI